MTESRNTSVTGDDQLDWMLITGAVIRCDFDLDKAAKQLKGFGGKRRVREVLVRWEAHIANLERTHHNPETRLAYRRMLASLRGAVREESGR